MSRLLSLALVGTLLVGAALAQGGVAATPTDRSAPAEQERHPSISQSEGFASTTFTVEVYANGSARWTFNYFTDSLNTSEQEQFREFADRFETRETDLWANFRERAEVLAASGADTTGRNMTARAFDREASLNDVGNRGVVRMSFLWTEFAQVRDDRVIVADVFDGVFYIGPDQWLVVEAGPDLQFAPDGATPEPDEFSGPSVAESDSITYFGEQQFPDNNPRIEFTAGTADNASTDAGTPEVTTTQVARAGDGGSLLMMALGVVVLVVGLGVIVWRTGVLGTDDGGIGSDDSGTVPSTAATAESESASEPDSSNSTVADEELLTDEDRVLQLLEENGRRMKQAKIVDETGWSKSKVSMLLSDMEEDNQISKLRVGRENIISLSGHEPDAAGSPFDDE